MTPEKLQVLAREMLDFGVRQIQKTGDLPQTFFLVTRDGGTECWLADGSVTNNENAKDHLELKLRGRIAKGDIEAVMMISDAWITTNLSPENDAIRRRLRMTVSEAAAYGLCEKREAVLIHCESPLFILHGHQFYKRINGKVEIEGKARVETDVDDGLRLGSSRFGDWFPAQAGRA